MGAPHLDHDEDAATTVMGRSVLPPPSGTRVSVVHSEPPRDTLVDPPSVWIRVRATVGGWFQGVRERLRRPRLLDRLPPLPPTRSTRSTYVSQGAVGHDERGEFMLLELLRAPEPYQRAASYVANYGLALRELGPDAYPEGLVHYVLTRTRPDADGCVSFARLRDVLCEMSVSGTLVPALLRMEKAGIVDLFREAGDSAFCAGIERVQLKVSL